MIGKRPGGELASRPLHFIWICDCSGSMGQEGKIQALNNAIRDALPDMQRVADENPNANVLVRAVSFADGAQWHVLKPTPVAQFKWVDLRASGSTAMGLALAIVAEQLKIPPMEDRALPPVLVLVSDGQPTNNSGQPTFDQGLKTLLGQPWGKKAVRIAIAIGSDADHDPLTRFIANAEVPVLQAHDAEALTNYIKWASTAVLKAASAPASQPAGAATGNVPIPAPPTGGTQGHGSNVW